MRTQQIVNLQHNTICKCSFCMNTSQTEHEIKENAAGLLATMVDRKDPDSPTESLMLSTHAFKSINANSEINMLHLLDIKEERILKSPDPALQEPRELTLKARWIESKREAASAAKEASVFGNLGIFAVPPEVATVNIPKMNAKAVPKSFLDKYGAELIPFGTHIKMEVAIDPSLEKLHLIAYEFKEEYVNGYVMKPEGGGGVFIERHPFPQLFTPLSQTCSGGLILGYARHDNLFDFAAFEIPYGYTMKIKSNVIHGDSFFVGSYAIALTDTKLADSVLLRKDNAERTIQNVKQYSLKRAKVPFFAEYHLGVTTSRKMLLDEAKKTLPNQMTKRLH